ncbi:hypothetical protein [Halorubellus sp. PRR65]|uniref:hypothetical protein n=1 Tax=Halorubellus sp. PRR65 TaxID=3098148 RepID=UPI002B257609|nr:hypothetical protein [Halorubellus sp. PRR65]
MRFKHVPRAPTSVERVFECRRAVPLVPDTQDDCCARLMERVGFPDRDEAAKWLTFLRALGLVAEHERGYARTREDVTADALADRFLDGVYLAPAVREAVASADEPLSADAVFESVAEGVPQYERNKYPTNWREVWGDTVGRELDWLALLGELEATDGGRYRVA